MFSGQKSPRYLLDQSDGENARRIYCLQRYITFNAFWQEYLAVQCLLPFPSQFIGGEVYVIACHYSCKPVVTFPDIRGRFTAWYRAKVSARRIMVCNVGHAPPEGIVCNRSVESV